MQRVALIGSTSEIGLAILNRLPLAPDAEVVLVGRRRGDVHSYGNLRHKKLRFEELDMDKSFNAIDIVQSISNGKKIDTLILAAGVLGPVSSAQTLSDVQQIARVNYFSAVSLLSAVAQQMEIDHHGRILVISSVAALRPRRRRYVYGSSKAGLDFYSRGLMHELNGKGVFLSILRPGFVPTSMTKGLSAPPFSLTPDEVAKHTIRQFLRSKEIIYAPPSMRWVMLILQGLPESIFSRLG